MYHGGHSGPIARQWWVRSWFQTSSYTSAQDYWDSAVLAAGFYQPMAILVSSLIQSLGVWS